MLGGELLIALAAIVGMIITLGTTLALAPLAHRVELVDSPDARKDHYGEVPLVGGIAMFIGFTFAVLMLPSALGPQRAMFAAALLLVGVGILDDFRELSPRLRFAAQIFAALIMTVLGGTTLHTLGYLFQPDAIVGLGFLAVPVTVFAAVGGINALNMMDGLDGLAGGIALIALGGLAWLAWTGGASAEAGILMVTVGCVAGFWLLNLRRPGQPRARVFMGDSGSMFVALVFAWFAVQISQSPGAVMKPVTALYLFALPLMDTTYVMIRRLRRGRVPFRADRTHLHHLLRAHGLSTGATVGCMLSLSLGFALIGLIGQQAVAAHLMFYGFLAAFVIYTMACTVGWHAVPADIRRAREEPPLKRAA